MARRAEGADRETLEAALYPADLEALREQCRALGIPRTRWPNVPAVARAWETVAAIRLAARLQADDGFGETRALEMAASRLGLSADTITSRLKRWHTDSYSGA